MPVEVSDEVESSTSLEHTTKRVRKMAEGATSETGTVAVTVAEASLNEVDTDAALACKL